MTDTMLAAFKRIMSLSDTRTAWIQVVCYLVSARKLPIFLKSSFAVNLSYPLSPGIIKTGDIFQKNVP
jgi:hypothetical protein